MDNVEDVIIKDTKTFVVPMQIDLEVWLEMPSHDNDATRTAFYFFFVSTTDVEKRMWQTKMQTMNNARIVSRPYQSNLHPETVRRKSD